MTMDDKAKAQLLKEEGNAALSADRPAEALEKYGMALKFDPNNHVLHSNRSAANAKLQNFEEALSDAEKTILIKPDWPKGYSRKGAALVYLNRLDEAEEAYNAGLKLDPNNQQLKSGLEECKAKGKRNGNDGDFMGGLPGGMGLGFDDPNMMTRLAMDPRTRQLLHDPEYVKMIEDIRKNPNKMSDYLSDKRMLTTMSVLLGFNLENASAAGDDSPMEEGSPPPKKKASPPPTKKTVPEDPETGLSAEQRKAKRCKEQGNAAYKKKDFDTAVEQYELAIAADPTDMTFLTNIAAVRYEQKRYEDCIETCEKAIDVGRENRADFKLIAKALTRIGNAYKQLKDLDKAKMYYEKAMSEHRTPETKDLLSKIEAAIKEKERIEYVDVAKAEEAKELGNECFKKGDFPSAIRHYTEAARRNPNDAKIFSNRAACYTKLAEFNLGLKDCDECIKLEPTFIKGYIRKAKIQQGLKQFRQAQESYQKALEVDANHPEALEGIRECMAAASSDPEEVRRRAMSDPEVQQILKDPAMRIILEQMQSDPRALQDHLKNPEISAKIQKLMQSGLISIR